ncbi:MAG: ribosomal-protein-alanine N-acetyltransferase [Candidatus Azotimanducaceae bacterium]|jgi:ribosomal-protein-alanine N-acetyltransferase
MSDEIHLRAVELDDINDEYVSWYANDDGHLDHFTGSGRIFSKDILIQDFESGLRTDSWFYYLITNSVGDYIGNVKIGPIDLVNKTSDLVCLVGNRGFLGQGIGSKAISLANEIAFKRHDIRRLQGGMIGDNIGSIKAYTKAGWIIEGVFKGYYLRQGNSLDRVCVCCFNPNYFPVETLEAVAGSGAMGLNNKIGSLIM